MEESADGEEGIEGQDSRWYSVHVWERCQFSEVDDGNGDGRSMFDLPVSTHLSLHISEDRRSPTHRMRWIG